MSGTASDGTTDEGPVTGGSGDSGGSGDDAGQAPSGAVLPCGKPAGATEWDGDAYQARIDALAAEGAYLHAEADLVCSFAPAAVLDAGCGTGRVAAELAQRGVEVVGVDRDASMVATARAQAPGVTFAVADLTDLALGRTFDVVLLAGNVPLFTPEGTQDALVGRCAGHVAPGGRLVAGFQLGQGYGLDAWDASCAARGLALESRWSTWDGEPFEVTSGYAVSVHRRPT